MLHAKNKQSAFSFSAWCEMTKWRYETAWGKKTLHILFYIDLVNEKLSFRCYINHDLTINRSETKALNRFLPFHLCDWIFFKLLNSFIWSIVFILGFTLLRNIQITEEQQVYVSLVSVWPFVICTDWKTPYFQIIVLGLYLLVSSGFLENLFTDFLYLFWIHLKTNWITLRRPRPFAT